MSTTISIGEAQRRLGELLAGMAGGEVLVITENGQPIARLIRKGSAAKQPRQPGSAKGKLVILGEDDEHLEDFKEYMP